MSTHDFTQEQLDLHAEVRNIVKEAAKNKGSKKSSGERAARKAYTPEHDLQILTVLKGDGRAERFGTSSTEEKRELCEEMIEILKTEHNQERTSDSLFYRITKLLKQANLNDLNYRIKGDEEKPKPKKKAPEPTPAAETESESEEESTPAPEVANEPTEPEGAATTTADPEEPQQGDATEDFDDDDFLDG